MKVKTILLLSLFTTCLVGANSSFAAFKAGSFGGSLRLDVDLVCKGGAWQPSITADRNFNDSGLARVKYQYPETDPEDPAYPNPVTNPEQFVTCTGYKPRDPQSYKDEDILSVDRYRLVLSYLIGAGASTVECPDGDAGHGNSCTTDPDNPGGSTGPKKNRGESTEPRSGVSACTADPDGGDFFTVTYSGWCEEGGIDIRGLLEWEACVPGEDPSSNCMAEKADIWDDNKPQWFNVDEWKDGTNLEYICGTEDGPSEIPGDTECITEGVLSFDGLPSKTIKVRGGEVQVVDVQACTDFFPGETFAPGDILGTIGYTQRPIEAGELLAYREEWYDDQCKDEELGFEILESYGRHCHNDGKYRLVDGEWVPIPCYYNPQVSEERAVVDAAIVDFQFLLEKQFEIAANINLNSCPDQGIVKVEISGENNFNVCRIAGIGDTIEPEECVGATPPSNPGFVDTLFAPRLVPGNFEKMYNVLGDELYEEWTEDYVVSSSEPPGSPGFPYAFTPAQDDQAAEFDDFNGDGYLDVRLKYKTCLIDGSEEQGWGANGVAQILAGGNPDGQILYRTSGNAAEADFAMLGITRNPGESEAGFEFEEGTSFRPLPVTNWKIVGGGIE